MLSKSTLKKIFKKILKKSKQTHQVKVSKNQKVEDNIVSNLFYLDILNALLNEIYVKIMKIFRKSKDLIFLTFFVGFTVAIKEIN